MSEKILQSSLKNAKFENMTAEQVIKKYEDVLNSREKQVFELSAEIGQINKKLQKMKAKYENSQEKNMKLKNILEKKEALFKQELDNKELMFMQLTKKEKECDEIQQQINDLKQNKKIIKNEKNINNEINKENNNNKKKEEEKKEKNDKDNKEADLKLLAKEKINQLTNKGEGMKKINFAELLKKKQEKTQENNQNQKKNKKKNLQKKQQKKNLKKKL